MFVALVGIVARGFAEMGRAEMRMVDMQADHVLVVIGRLVYVRGSGRKTERQVRDTAADG